MEEIMAIYLYCHNGALSNSIRSSHRFADNGLPNTCKWKKMYESICSGIMKLYYANHCNYGNNYSINKSDSLFHGCEINDPNIEMPFHLHTITSFSESMETPYEFSINGSHNNGTILQLANVTPNLRNGSLIAACVSEISPLPDEKEWIVLPITLLEKKINYNPNYNANIKYDRKIKKSILLIMFGNKHNK